MSRGNRPRSVGVQAGAVLSELTRRSTQVDMDRTGTGQSVYIETYGCQMNVRDSQLLGGILREAGCELVDSPEEADLILLNTCSVRERAEQRVIGRINQLSLLKEERGVRFGVLGCMAQHLREKLREALPDLDIVIGPDSYRRLPEVLALEEGEMFSAYHPDRHELYEGLPSCRPEGRPTAFVTVMRGCDMMCTFCVVPHTRGRERCRQWREVVTETEQLVDAGVKEVVLLGQTVNAYRDGDIGFGGLLWKVADTGIERIRFTSPHPIYFREEELEAIASCDSVCESVHMPVQSGSTEVLRRMNRQYTREEYLDIAAAFRARVPHVTLSTDIIVGFPGETDAQFQDTLSLMEECAFDSSYHFKYSPRPGTRADREFPDDVPAGEKQNRLEQVMELQAELTRRSNEAMLGGTCEVLIDERGKRGPDQWTGRTRGNKIVVVESDRDLLGSMVRATIEDVGTWTLRGRLIQ